MQGGHLGQQGTSDVISMQTNLVERITVRVADIRELEAKLRGTTRAQGSAPACDGSSNADVGGGGEVNTDNEAGGKPVSQPGCKDRSRNKRGPAAKATCHPAIQEPVEREAVSGPSAAKPAVALRFVRERDMLSQGLSTGPRNIFQLACGEPELVKRLGKKKAL
ncbi:hypothetical protein HaLaN_17014 [Haematococcus lacustris]|uniref:Uncharacterized protein n=1 Tax=Haematococcus lacustris TaxID=44745 RepID=A0A699ZCX4_HAELA|nr:hypothetical protein HaLaN_17014 [Haematococcus lacustris]